MFASLRSNANLFPLVQRRLTGMGEMALSGEEGVRTKGESKPERPGTPFRWKNYCRYGVPLRVSSTL